MNMESKRKRKRKRKREKKEKLKLCGGGKNKNKFNQLQLQRSLKSTQRSTKSHSSRPHVTKTNQHGRKLRPTRKLKTKRRKYYELPYSY